MLVIVFSFCKKCIRIRLDHGKPLPCEISCCNLRLRVLRARAPKVHTQPPDQLFQLLPERTRASKCTTDHHGEMEKQATVVVTWCGSNVVRSPQISELNQITSNKHMSAGRQSVLVFGFSICLAFFKRPEPWKAATGTACGVLKALQKALMSGSTLQSIEQQKVKLILSQGGCLFNLLATTWKEFRTSSMQGRFILCFLTWMVPDQFRCWPWSSKVWTIFVILFWGATTLMTWRRLQKTWAMNVLLHVVRSWECWSGCMLSSILKRHLQKSLLEAWWKLLLLCEAKCGQVHQNYIWLQSFLNMPRGFVGEIIFCDLWPGKQRHRTRLQPHVRHGRREEIDFALQWSVAFSFGLWFLGPKGSNFRLSPGLPLQAWSGLMAGRVKRPNRCFFFVRGRRCIEFSAKICWNLPGSTAHASRNCQSHAGRCWTKKHVGVDLTTDSGIWNFELEVFSFWVQIACFHFEYRLHAFIFDERHWVPQVFALIRPFK